MKPSLVGAAIAGLKQVVRRPGLIAAWTVAGVVLNLVVQMAPAVFVGHDLAALAAPATVQGSSAHWTAYLRALGLYLVLTSALIAIPSCAVYRALLRPEQRGFAYLRLGPDELRLTVQLLLLFGAWAASMVGIYSAVLMLIAPRLILLSPDLGVLLTYALAGTPAVLVAAWLAVRVSFVAPASFAEGRFVLARAWRMTRGRFWSLFACVLVSLLLGGLVLLVEHTAGLWVAGQLAGIGFEEAWAYTDTAQLTDLKRALEPGQIAYGVVSSLASGLFFTAWAAPAAAAYRALRGSQDVSEAFA